MEGRPAARPHWDDFAWSRAAEAGEEPDDLAKLSAKRREPSLATVLMQAIRLTGARRGQLSQAERIYQPTLLEVLTATMRTAR